MDPHGRTAQRFPLVARFRPACLPLPQRVHALAELADTAVKRTDQGLASAVYNQAALIASDLGLPDVRDGWLHPMDTAELHQAAAAFSTHDAAPLVICHAPALHRPHTTAEERP